MANNFQITIKSQYSIPVEIIFWNPDNGLTIRCEKNAGNGQWQGPYLKMGAIAPNSMPELQSVRSVLNRAHDIFDMLTTQLKDQFYNNLEINGGIIWVYESTDLNTLLILS
jgi:hypothetical protein